MRILSKHFSVMILIRVFNTAVLETLKQLLKQFWLKIGHK